MTESCSSLPIQPRPRSRHLLPVRHAQFRAAEQQHIAACAERRLVREVGTEVGQKGEGVMRALSWSEAMNCAFAVADFQRRTHWLPDDIDYLLASAASGKDIQAASEAMELVLEMYSRIFPLDDPHDGFDPRLVAKLAAATENVLAPVSDPNTLRSQNLSVRTKAKKGIAAII